MDERLLRFFVAIYEKQNLTKAAEYCHVSQPGISNALKQIEELFDKQLFDRGKRGVVIREEAHYLYPIAKRLLKELHDLPQLFNQQLEQQLKIGVASDLPLSYKTRFFTNLFQLYPKLDLEISGIDEKCDLRLLVREFKNSQELFLPLWREDYVLCVPEKHELAQKATLNLDDLRDAPFIHCPPCEAHQQCLALLNAQSQQWNNVAQCSTKGEVLTLISTGIGLSFLPEGLVENPIGFKVIPFDGPHYFREVGLAYGQNALQNPALVRLIAYLSDQQA